MAGEIQAAFQSGATLYAQVRSRTGTVWNTSSSALEAYQTANIGDYDVALTEQGSASGFYTGTFPAAIPAGVYSVVVKQQAGGSPAESDATVAAGDVQWGGSATVPLSDLTTSGQLGQVGPIRLARGVAVSGFMFKMVSSVDHVTPFTSGAVSGQVSRNGGAFGALQSGTFSEVGLGYVRVNLTSGDMLGDVVALSFSAVGISGGTADPRDFVIYTQRVSGSI